MVPTSIFHPGLRDRQRRLHALFTASLRTVRRMSWESVYGLNQHPAYHQESRHTRTIVQSFFLLATTHRN